MPKLAVVPKKPSGKRGAASSAAAVPKKPEAAMSPDEEVKAVQARLVTLAMEMVWLHSGARQSRSGIDTGRGNTSRKIKDMILDAGAADVHFRIASPPTAWPCFYGVDTPERAKLLAATMTEDEMRDWIGVNSLKFISLDGLYRAAGEAAGRDAKAPKFCDACFSGDYPVAPSDKIEEGFQMKAAE